MFWIIFIVLNLTIFYSIALNSTDHVCYRDETYTELERTPIQQPVKVRSFSWCLEIPPRCSNYKTEIREVIKLQNVTKTKMVEYCCEGYAEIALGNETLCKPICRGGCGRGFCHSPNQCNCDTGYLGRHCTQRCQHGRWGDKCKNLCKCRNGSLCDNKNGKCRCLEGWIGDFCDRPCPDGFYGTMCKSMCECSSNKCDPATGECELEEGLRSHEVVTRSSTEKTALQSIVTPQLLNNTSLIIETLNSSIANLTENLDKLTKNLNRSAPHNDPVTLIVPNTIMEVTTIKTLHEVIVIKPNDDPVDTAIVLSENQPSILETQNPIVQKSGGAEVIQVIGNWQQHHLQKYQKNKTDQQTFVNLSKADTDDGINAILLVIAIFAVAILACSVGFVVLYRRYLKENQNRNREIETEITEGSKVLAKPLPDLPAFTQNLTRTSFAVPEFYDRPSNNSAVKASIHPYSYTLSSDYTVRPTPKPYNRKDSLEHLYDEIKYHPDARSSRV